MSRKEIIAGISVVLATVIIVVAGVTLYKTPEKNNAGADTLVYWTEGSQTARSVIDFVAAVTDENSDSYVPPEKRIAVFDVDGTIIGELFPTYFDQCLMMHRLLHDETYEANADDKEYVQALEYALIHHETPPSAPRSSGQITAESFKGFTVNEYRAYIRDFMKTPVNGFEGMTYGEAFYKPMISVVKYLADNDFQIFIVSGGERTMVREEIKDIFGEWIPPYHVIGSTVALEATGQGQTAARSYTYTASDEILLAGNMDFKTDRWNKVVGIVNEIGDIPIIAFGNSKGDLSMGQYTVENGGQAYMLLCDDTERDYGKPDIAAEFKAQCDELGFHTVSMKNDFATIYGYDVVKTDFTEPLAPAA